LIDTIGLCARWLWLWMSLASSSLPVPVSPCTSTVAVEAAARTADWIRAFITPLLVRMSCCLTSIDRAPRRTWFSSASSLASSCRRSRSVHQRDSTSTRKAAASSLCRCDTIRVAMGTLPSRSWRATTGRPSVSIGAVLGVARAATSAALAIESPTMNTPAGVR
jgi:hypothetical protein